MTIADKLTQLNSIKQDIKTAILGKGQTVTNDMTQYATAISSISGSAVINSLSVTPSTSAQTITAPVGVTGYNPINVSAVTSSIDNNITAGNIKKSVTILGTTGTYETTKYGCTINGILGDIDGNGVLQLPTEHPDLVFTGVVDIADDALEEKLSYSNVKSVSFPDLTTISGSHAMSNAFAYCTLLTSVSFPNLTTVSGSGACNSMLSYTAITTLSFPKLDTITGNAALSGMLGHCTSLTDVYFNALTTTSFGTRSNQFANMLIAAGGCTLHFPSNLETTIQGLSGYPNFGSSSTVLAFDLTATS